MVSPSVVELTADINERPPSNQFFLEEVMISSSYQFPSYTTVSQQPTTTTSQLPSTQGRFKNARQDLPGSVTSYFGREREVNDLGRKRSATTVTATSSKTATSGQSKVDLEELNVAFRRTTGQVPPPLVSRF
jgi:hypothetical protein